MDVKGFWKIKKWAAAHGKLPKFDTNSANKSACSLQTTIVTNAAYDPHVATERVCAFLVFNSEMSGDSKVKTLTNASRYYSRPLSPKCDTYTSGVQSELFVKKASTSSKYIRRELTVHEYGFHKHVVPTAPAVVDSVTIPLSQIRSINTDTSKTATATSYWFSAVIQSQGGYQKGLLVP
ncbi:hypothetical protein CBL_02522 [Carabus blaptoides fortunei]